MKTKEEEIQKTWLLGNTTATLIIPKSIALMYDLVDEKNVKIELTSKGILISKKYSSGE
jgi:antitoxin component of MazEF toxin-antitoxin module